MFDILPNLLSCVKSFKHSFALGSGLVFLAMRCPAISTVNMSIN